MSADTGSMTYTRKFAFTFRSFAYRGERTGWRLCEAKERAE
jgi:hypothetical protein